jgi:Domain of unknown function (DUF4259)
MGTWGIGSFENDTALDWIAALALSEDYNIVSDALDLDVTQVDYLEIDEGIIAITGAETIAAIIGCPANNLPEEVVSFADRMRPLPSSELIQRAIDVLDRVLADSSELKELWQASSAFEDWHDQVQQLQRRLLECKG